TGWSTRVWRWWWINAKRSRSRNTMTASSSGSRPRRAGGDRRMIRQFSIVGGFTLLSRITGFLRDIMLAAILGAGPVADAFFVALRLPNHFRAIFAEGAFNAAFVPAYAHLYAQSEPSAKLFADRIFTVLFAVQIVLL